MPDEELFPTPPVPAPPGPGTPPGERPALIVTAFGIPAPQGSKAHVGGGRLIESSRAVGPWRKTVADHCMIARSRVRGWKPLEGPVELSMTFSFVRPAKHFGTGSKALILREDAPLRPHVIPDLDKLARSTCDALKTGLIYRDDAQVVGFRLLAKHYTTDHGWCPDVLPQAGCVIRVWPLDGAGAR